MIARKLAAIAMVLVVLAVVTAWTPVVNGLAVLAYGALSAVLGGWVLATYRDHWQR